MELNYRILISFKWFFYCLYKWLIKLTSNCFFIIQSVLAINKKSPVTKLLVLTNQSSSDILIYFAFYLYRFKKQNARLYVRRYWFFWFFYFYFHSKSRFHGIKRQRCRKSCYRWGRTWWYCGEWQFELRESTKSSVHHLQVVVDRGELTRKLLTKRSKTFYKPINVHSVTHAIGASVSSTSMWNILNQSGKHTFSCGARFFLWSGSR